MEPIDVELTAASIYGLFVPDGSLMPKKKWLKKFFPEEMEESEKKGKLTEELLFNWKQELYELTDNAGLYILDKPGDCLDYYLGIIPLYPWEKLEMNKHKSQEDGHKAIIDFLDEYFDLSKEELDRLNKKIRFHKSVFLKTKGE